MVNPFKAIVDVKPHPPILSLDWRVLHPILNTIGILRAETGGVLGGTGDQVDHFIFDRTSRRSVVTYTPDVNNLNRIFKEVWNPKGIRCMGFIHSHPPYMTSPSWGDKVYAERILDAIPDLEQLWLPIVMTVNDTQAFQLTPWVARRSLFGVRLTQGLVQVTNIPANAALSFRGVDLHRYIQPDEPMIEIKIPIPHHLPVGSPTPQTSFHTVSASVPALPTPIKPNTPLAQQNTDPAPNIAKPDELTLINKARLVVFGAGQGTEVLEHMTWANLGQMVLIDKQTEILAGRLKVIDQKIKIQKVPKEPSELTEGDIRDFVLDPIDGSLAAKTLLVCFTTSTLVREWVTQVAFKYNLPCLIEYSDSTNKKVEVDFNHPGFTPKFQCSVIILPYEYFTQKSRTNPTRTKGDPKLTAKSLIAIENFLLFSLIYYNSSHPRWGRLLSVIGDLNHLQKRFYDRLNVHATNTSPVTVEVTRNHKPQAKTTRPRYREINNITSVYRVMGTRINIKT